MKYRPHEFPVGIREHGQIGRANLRFDQTGLSGVNGYLHFFNINAPDSSLHAFFGICHFGRDGGMWN
jgi:hypothetical protein